MAITEEALSEAQAALRSIVGEPLSDMWRYLGFQKFEFGIQREFVNDEGEHSSQADWALVVACPWRIEGPDGFVLASSNFFPDRTDDFAIPFYNSLESNSPVVNSVTVNADGSLRVEMTRGFRLFIDRIPATEEAPIDEWRFMPPEGDSRGHLELQNDSITWSDIGD